MDSNNGTYLLVLFLLFRLAFKVYKLRRVKAELQQQAAQPEPDSIMHGLTAKSPLRASLEGLANAAFTVPLQMRLGMILALFAFGLSDNNINRNSWWSYQPSKGLPLVLWKCSTVMLAAGLLKVVKNHCAQIFLFMSGRGREGAARRDDFHAHAD